MNQYASCRYTVSFYLMKLLNFREIRGRLHNLIEDDFIIDFSHAWGLPFDCCCFWCRIMVPKTISTVIKCDISTPSVDLFCSADPGRL